MTPSRLPFLRRAAALLVLTIFVVAFVDFRGAFAKLGHVFASVQFVPSAIALATASALALGCVVVLVLTLAIGRIYCSVLCPLGIFQDLVARLGARLRRSRAPRPFRRAQTWLRQLFLWGAVAGIAAGWAGLTLTLLDPYSIFGRIAADLLRPVVLLANNALTAAHVPGLNRVDLHWAAAGAIAVPAAMLLVVTTLAAWRGRLYCNTVCPVGTALGLLSARSAWRLQIDRDTCKKCGDCLRVCKAQCIDLRTGAIDGSRCVQCYNCLGACERRSVRLRWSWRRATPAPSAHAHPPATPIADPRRRAFLTRLGAGITTAAGATTVLALLGFRHGRRRGAPEEAPSDASGAGTRGRRNLSPVIAPPGAQSIEQFLDRCTGCHLCVSTCPTGVLQPAFLDYGIAGLAKPHLDYAIAFCNFDCHRCSDVCPDGALTPLTLERKHAAKIGEAQFDVERCIVKTQGTDCAACSEHCPTKAVDTQPFGNNLRLPWVHRETCIGCGACEFACPAQPKAIRVVGLRRHAEVWARPEEKAKDPRPSSDFPF